MINIETAIQIHHILIDKFGGSKGVRDFPGLEAALARPYDTFDQQDLYPSVVEKAAALLESLAINHPFIDGNKRIAYTLMRLLLLESGYDIIASQEEKYTMVIAATTGNFNIEAIKHWLTDHLTSSHD